MHRTVQLFAAMVLQDCKLTYFGIPGRGEATRLALTLGKIKFEDRRIAFSDWKDVKPTTPWGSLPVLTLSDGTEIAQQRAILRLVGKETNLYPTDIVAAAKVDSLMDAAEDIGVKTTAVGQGLEQAEKEAARKAATNKGGPISAILENIEHFIAANGKDGHTVGNKLTIADLSLYTGTSNFVSGLFDGIPANALNDFPCILAVRKMVRSHPDVANYYDGLDETIKTKLPASYAPIN